MVIVEYISRIMFSTQQWGLLHQAQPSICSSCVLWNHPVPSHWTLLKAFCHCLLSWVVVWPHQTVLYSLRFFSSLCVSLNLPSISLPPYLSVFSYLSSHSPLCPLLCHHTVHLSIYRLSLHPHSGRSSCCCQRTRLCVTTIRQCSPWCGWNSTHVRTNDVCCQRCRSRQDYLTRRSHQQPYYRRGNRLYLSLFSFFWYIDGRPSCCCPKSHTSRKSSLTHRVHSSVLSLWISKSPTTLSMRWCRLAWLQCLVTCLKLVVSWRPCSSLLYSRYLPTSFSSSSSSLFHWSYYLKTHIRYHMGIMQEEFFSENRCYLWSCQCVRWTCSDSDQIEVLRFVSATPLLSLSLCHLTTQRFYSTAAGCNPHCSESIWFVLSHSRTRPCCPLFSWRCPRTWWRWCSHFHSSHSIRGQPVLSLLSLPLSLSLSLPISLLPSLFPSSALIVTTSKASARWLMCISTQRTIVVRMPGRITIL